MAGDDDPILARVKRVLQQRVRPGLALRDVTARTPLLHRGIGLDSVAALELVVGLEEEFGVALDESELSAETFETLGSLADHVARKLGAEARG